MAWAIGAVSFATVDEGHAGTLPVNYVAVLVGTALGATGRAHRDPPPGAPR